MAPSFIKPTDGKVRSVVLDGNDITDFIQCIRVYESLCKPYLTAHLTIIDNDNVIENLAIVGGEPCEISFFSPPNQRIYDCLVSVLNLDGHQSPNNVKTQIYEMDLIGHVYFDDKANIVQKAFSGSGTAAIQGIWNSYLQSDTLQILSQDSGQMGKSDEKSQVQHQKPLAAIDKIRGYLKFPSNSPSVFYRDRDSAKLAALLDLFGKGALWAYIQKETWGANLLDPDIYSTIIIAEAMVDKNFANEAKGGGRGGTGAMAKAAVQGQAVFDLFKGIPAKFASAAGVTSGNFGSGISGLGKVLGGAFPTIQGGLGGSPNIQYTNSNRWDRGSAPDTATMGSQGIAAEIKNGPQMKIKVPLQTGLEATVGKSVNITLLPPTGDLPTGYARNSQNGDWLVKDLMHELYNDKREVKGTTVMQLIRGGYGS